MGGGVNFGCTLRRHVEERMKVVMKKVGGEWGLFILLAVSLLFPFADVGRKGKVWTVVEVGSG